MSKMPVAAKAKSTMATKKKSAKSKAKADADAVVATALDDIRDLAARRKLARLGTVERDTAARIAEDTAVRKAIVGEMAAIAKGLKLAKVVGADWQLIQMPGKRTLKREKLLEQGVDPAIVEASMVTGKPGWQVRARGKDGDGESDNGGEE